MQDTSDSSTTGPRVGQELRYMDWVSQGWQGGCARINSWFTESRIQPDEDEYLRVVLKYVTCLLDNMGYWDRYAYIWAPEHVEDPYLTNLRQLSNKMYDVAEVYAKAVCDPKDKPGYLPAVRARLDSRIHHWEGEARAYVREGIAAYLAERQRPPRLALEIRVEECDCAKLDVPPGSKLRIIEGVERVRAKWFSSLADGGGSRAEMVDVLSDTLDVHAEAFLASVKDEETCGDFCESLRKIGPVLIENAFENGLFDPDARDDVKLRFESRHSYWRAEALKRARENSADGRTPPLTSAGRKPDQSAMVVNVETRRRRRQFLKQYLSGNDLKMPDLARRAETSVTAIQGMVRGDRTRYGEKKLTEFLNIIGAIVDDW